MPFFYFDPTYIVLLPALIFAAYAQFKVSSTYNRFSRVDNRNGWTAAEVARRILDSNGLHDVQIQRISGNLTDNYNPSTNIISLSDSVYSSKSVAAIGVAAHECGHAVQYALGYAPIRIRSALVSVTNFGSNAGMILLLIGLLFSSYTLAMVGIVMYSTVAVFQAVTLPVEFNASRRALDTLEADEILCSDEIPYAKKVLSAAAMTYVAALLSSLSTIFRFLLIVGGGRRRRN
ncbi:MAG: zinc metallopeptidase [Oscillospiraceae bacterium]|nr:zinc metallopeptidase [Oscillospiraceae bacterium]